MTSKNVLITGGTGFIGSALTKSLIKAGHKVRTLDNCSRGSQKRLDSVAGEFEYVSPSFRRCVARLERFGQRLASSLR
jgi:nucleoside-diphosphate-sugar epimerase